MRKTRLCQVVCALLFSAAIVRPAAQDDIAVWKEFVSLLKSGSLTAERIRPPSPLTAEPQLALLKDFAGRADWEEWDTPSEVVHHGNLVTFIVTLGAKKKIPWTFTFNFTVEDGRWYFRFLEGIFIPLHKISALPADASGFPDRPEEGKHWMRQEIYWSEQVRLFNVLTKEMGREAAWRWISGGLANGAGYALGATTWIPFFPAHRSFILYLCWEQAKLGGDKVTLEKLDDREAVVRFEDLTYFALYQRSTHLKQQISLDDYIKIFETLWRERAKAAGWNLTVDGQGRRIYLRFSR